jgi:outer membrane protein OmpA-like peptidoglycan-associated protein
MFSQDDDNEKGIALMIVFAVVAVVVAAMIGMGIYKRGGAAQPAAAAPAAVVAAPAAAPVTAPAPVTATGNAAQTAMDAASVKVENGVVKFYFASGKADLAAGAGAALTDVIAGAKSGRKLVISGFHDATGSATANAELAKQRAFAVRDALKAAGVTDTSMELKKPEQMTAAGSNAEARRVEVMLQ